MELQHLKNFKTSGTFTDASKFTIKKIIDSIPFMQEQVVVELGIGNGVISEAIIAAMQKNSTYIGFELNPLFYNKVNQKIKKKHVTFVLKNALDLKEVLTEMNIKHVSIFLSTLPLNMLKNEEVTSILEQAKFFMDTHSKFLVSVHNPLIKNTLKKSFPSIDTSIVLRNFPPYFIYSCKLVNQ